MKHPAKNPLISVCIPVYNTEQYLAQCLKSVFVQDFDCFEIVIVSDASRGCDAQGWKAKKIIRHAQKEGNFWRRKNGFSAIKVNYSEHSENRGILEVRRTLTYEAKGEYCFHLDSDDELVPEALSLLWKTSTEQGPFDIVHGSFVSGWYDEAGKFISTDETKCGAITFGKVENHDIFHKWLFHEISGNVCAKLIHRELFLRAFDNIPYSECNLADDFLIIFYISLFAKSYFGIENKIYLYRINSGMTSATKVTSILRWKLVCSASSVFTVISEWIKDNPSEAKIITADELSKIKEQGRFYLISILRQLHEFVVPELQEPAYEMLCDYWGKDLVERMDCSHYNSKKSK